MGTENKECFPRSRMNFTINTPSIDEILDETIVIIEICGTSKEIVAIYPKDSFIICDYPKKTLREAIEYYNTADYWDWALYLRYLYTMVDWYLDEIKYPYKEEILKLFKRKARGCSSGGRAADF